MFTKTGGQMFQGLFFQISFIDEIPERKDNYKYFDMKIHNAIVQKNFLFFPLKKASLVQNAILPKNQITIHPLLLQFYLKINVPGHLLYSKVELK